VIVPCSRSAAFVALLAGALIAPAAVPPSAHPTSAAAVYRLRPDPRMCPAPLCGGYFASEVNRVQTTCTDGVARAVCHVLTVDTAAVLPPAQWAQLQRQLPTDQVLVAGTLATAEAGNGLSAEDSLIASAVWRSTSARPTTKPVWLVTDTGVRCITNPCFSLRATLVNGTLTARLSSLRGWRGAIPGRGLLAAGTIIRVPHAGPAGAGRELVTSRVWLPVVPAG
jgi:hypothetical protein